MLKKYDELDDKQKKLVTLMYTDQSTVHMYLYNFEGENYRGRQFIPSENVEINGNETFINPSSEGKPIEDKPKRRIRKK